MKFERKQTIEQNLSPGRVLIIYGPRRVGKTTLLKKYLETQTARKVHYATGDDVMLRELFQSADRSRILDFAKPLEVIAIDEAQMIKGIGLAAKIIIDAFPEKELILTGSSSFELAGQVGEPLTGRHFTLTLFPISQTEFIESNFELMRALADTLVFGSYPEVLLADTREMRIKILNELVSSYLFRDVLVLDKLRSPDLLLDIVRCLAFQIGNEVSFNEIARTVKSDVKTVQRYIDVLEKVFVIKKVRGFSRNLRNEISKKSKYYFYDTGIRNAVIAQFNELALRDDVGQLWENFVFMELYKKSAALETFDQFYFWRTHTGQEVDIVIEREGALRAIESKWSNNKARVPSLWRKAYPQASFEVITKENYLKILRQ